MHQKDTLKGLTIAFYGHYGLDVMAEGETLSSVRSQLPEWLTMVSWVRWDGSGDGAD